MSIDEAITHAREKTKEQKSKYDKCPTRMKYACEMCFHEPKCNEIAEECEHLAEWLEELKTYLAIGTVAEFKSLKENWLNNFDSLIEYRKIGTVEECRAAVDKTKPRKPLGGKDIDGNEYEICRECSAIVSDGDWHAEYCPDCGQKIDWKEDE